MGRSVKRTVTALGSLTLAILLIAGAGAGIRAQSPAASAPQTSPDTVLSEIQLSREGVTAIDTLGRRLVYDFDNNTFILDKETPRSTGRTDRTRRSEAVPDPVEQRCTQLKVVKPFQRAVLVGYDEYVDGGIIAYGRVVVKGWVKGDVQSLNGRVLITESGQVDGDVKAPEIVVNDGGIVLGSRITANALDFTGEVLRRPFSIDGVIIVCCFIAFLLVAAFLVLSLFPRHQELFEQAMFEFKLKTVLLGVLIVFLIWLPVALLAITIVGIILIPFVPFVYVTAMTVGVVSTGRRIGFLVLRKIPGHHQSRLFEAFVGICALMGVWMIVALLLGSGEEGTTEYGFGIFALVVAIVLSSFPVCSGLGAAFLTRMGTRQYRPKERPEWARGMGAPAPAPPPIPQMPDMVMPPPRPTPGEGPRPVKPPDDVSGGPGSTMRPPLPSGGQ
ncbi:hypothetical protein C3F09_12820 [candidate division GN15 bacterium]|uniref:Polymer-forming cytoskeletal protein n=1 Tax=candidate division GN15 bacterium TaxID=2072418 RepID=A0A855X2T0_9BACT|nr:MAG: hypothetical protein C3F09_12820 [candidate division GN15 bacterium]